MTTFPPRFSMAQQLARFPTTPLIPPRPKSPAERMHESLREWHQRLVWEAKRDGLDEEALPAWHVHLPSGTQMRIKWIGTFGPFARFVGMDDETVVLIAPEAVSVTMTTMPAESTEPRGPIGFGLPEDDDEGED
jgi:hypothetical protein